MKETGKPLNINELTKEQLNAELEKGIRSMKEGRVRFIEDVEASIRKTFGISNNSRSDSVHK